jgi:glycolate oxidase FAD binding subunit
LRDYVLEVQSVSAEGRLVKAGGPVVKNVTGFDLCRLLVGSLGTLGLLAEVVLRCYPIPEVSQWYAGRVADPIDLSRRLYRASSMLYDGDQLWVLLEGHPADVKGQAASVLGPAFSEVGGPPPLPEGRLSVAPSALAGLADLGASGSGGSGSGGSAALGGSGSGWVAELGVGVVHASEPDSVAAAVGVPWPPAPPPGVAALNAAVKARFDPTGRLNPGRQVP